MPDFALQDAKDPEETDCDFQSLSVDLQSAQIIPIYTDKPPISIEDVTTLVGLGLSSRQAHVYLALLRCGEARARTIAKLALINRQEVYPLLDDLRLLGLVRQNVTLPTTYTAVPVSEGLDILLKQKTIDLTLLTQKVKNLSKKFNQTEQLPSVIVRPSFGEICEGNLSKKYQNALSETEQRFEMVTSWGRFKKTCFLFEAPLKEALKRGVVVRIVTEKPPNCSIPKWVDVTLQKYPNFELKTTPCSSVAAIILFDGVCASIAMDPNIHLTKGPDLWTTNPALVAICQTFFNNAWDLTT
jgi:sugar-specific transcriptional regulator TrmB